MPDDSDRPVPRRRGRRPIKGTTDRAPDVLEALSPSEAASLLSYLLERHPELRDEARRHANTRLEAVDIERVAADVRTDIALLGYPELNARSGRHELGYTDPSDAAWELLEEAVRPWIDDMLRRRRLGSPHAAEAVCCGVVLGLSQADEDQESEVLGWAPDAPIDLGAEVVRKLLAATSPGDRSDVRHRVAGLVEQHVPAWFPDVLPNP